MTTLHVSTSLLLVIVTLLCAGSLWLLVSKFRTKGRDLLVSFFVVAGLGSAWLSLHYPQLAWLIFFATVLLAMLLWFLLHKLGKNLGPTTVAWSEYLWGQGTLLILCLLAGGGLAWLSVTYGPYPGRISKGGQLVKFENLDPSQHPVYQDVDVENYAEISVFTKTGMPANGSATVTIYLDHGLAGNLEIGRLDSEATAWSRWGQANAGKRMSLVATAPTQAGAIPATQVDILVYLSPK